MSAGKLNCQISFSNNRMLKTTVFTLGVNMTTSYSCFHSFPVTDFHHYSFFTICFGFRLTLLDLCERWLNPHSFFFLNGSTKIFSQLNNLCLVFQYSKGTGSLSSASLGKKTWDKTNWYRTGKDRDYFTPWNDMDWETLMGRKSIQRLSFRIKQES